MRFLFSLFTVLYLSLSLSAAKAQSSGTRINWTCTSEGYRFLWNAKDLTAAKISTGKTVYSVAEAVKREIGKPGTDDVFTFYQVDFAPLSVVGSYLSYQRDDSWDGGAHPSGNEQFVTVDVLNPRRRVRLTDLFPAETIRKALLADTVVKRVLKREKIPTPATLDGLVKALSGQFFGGEDDGKYAFPPNLLEDFAFHHVENGSVAVRFLMPHGTEIFRFQNTQLGILLPVPPRMRTAFAQASAGKNGVMMKSLPNSDRKTELVLYERAAVRH
ncbi:MAG: hypothetical protein V4671_12430 [Armatimonadota bacterium]